MTWRSFIDYVIMRELGQTDAIMRSYDLRDNRGSQLGVLLDRAFARMGFDQKNTPRPLVIPSVAARMGNMGYKVPSDVNDLAWLMREWYTWDRIRKGELQSWTYREGMNRPS